MDSISSWLSSTLPKRTKQNELTAIAGINRIPCAAALFRFIAPRPCAVDTGILTDQRKRSGIRCTDSGILIFAKHIVCLL